MSVITIALNEWARLFMSKRGWLAIVAFGLIWAVFLTYVIAPAALYVSDSEYGFIIPAIFERFGANVFSNWESTEMALYWVFALYLLPFFTMITAADQIASDKARGTMRFFVLRASRSQIFFGRFIGQYVVQLAIVLVTMMTVLTLIAINSPDTLPVALNEAPVIGVNLSLVLLPYVALMALVSVLANTARQATIYAIIGWIVLWFLLGYVQNNLGPYPLLDWVLPGSQLSTLLGLRSWDTLSVAPIPLVHTVALLGFGWLAIERCDL